MSNNKASFPFYMHPKRSIQIIKETKAEIKKMELNRPSTPFGRKRGEKEHNMPVSSRPTSSSSLKSLKYEHEEDCSLSVRKLNPVCSLKGKFTSSNDLKLEPLVTKSVLTCRKNNSLMKSQNHQDITFPPISYEEKVKDIVKNAENSMKHEVSHNIQDAILVDCMSNISCVDSGVVSEENFKIDYNSSLDSEQTEKQNVEEENFDELSQELKHILYVLDKNVKLGSKKSAEDLIPVICKLYNILKDENAFGIMHSYRIPLLKTLFKLLDSNSPALTLHIIQLLLQMKVKDKNLGTIFRIISRLITNKHVKLKQYQITEPLIKAVQEMSIQSNKETLLHGINLLKSLIFKDLIELQDLQECAIILLQHLNQFNDMMPSPEDRCDDTYININKQIFITLHYLAENEDVWKALSSPHTLSEILRALNYFYQNSDVIQIIVRLTSKIIDKEDSCQTLAGCPENLIMVLSRILQTHKHNIDITMQTTFIIGNLVLVDKQLAETFLNQFNLHDILTQILEEYVTEHIQTKRTLSEMFIISQTDASGDHDWRQNLFEVISRVLCILANICLNPEAGSFLAQEKGTINHLLNIISAYLKQDVLRDTSLPVYSFLVVIGNISYYLPPHSDSSLKIAKRIIPLLDDKFSLEVRRESANIVQNLARFPEVRKYIEEYSLLPAFIKLVSEDDKEFINAAYGIIMNLLLDKNNHRIFYEEQGIARILHKLHLCTERDWKTSSLLCQILWNYCKCLSDDIVPISKIEAQHLIKYLSYSTNIYENTDDESSDSYLIWRNEFYPVAKKLLTLLQSKMSLIT